MITVKMTKRRDGFTLIVQGHAPRTSEDVGGNLCCASVSFLATTAAEVFAGMQDKGRLKIFKCKLKPGYSYLSVSALRPYMRDVRILQNMIFTGFELLTDRYPDKILWGEKSI